MNLFSEQNNKRLLRLTADKREIKDFPKLPSATSFIRKRYVKLRQRHVKN
jgi:hypothetical protein